MTAETDLSRAHEQAARLAEESARAGGVHLRTVEAVAPLAAVADYFSDVWRTPRSSPPLPAEVLHSLVHAGGAVHAAYTVDEGRLAGACAAVFGPPAEAEAYSLVAAADRGLGHAVKQAQRAWLLGRGARTLRWTFDPLVARNARFNLVKLGATGTEYLVDFYGPMADGVNDGDESDRLAVTWDLVAPRGPSSAPVTPAGPDDGPVTPAGPDDRPATPAGPDDRPVTPAGPDDRPVAVTTAPDGGPLVCRSLDDRFVWCRVPEDVVALRAADPVLALRWRHAVREVFTKAFAEGFAATGMSRDGWYTLTREEA
ncbi:chorismate synthase [Streptomyces sp. NPDC047079]|uniref:chorismate synthase n=1 Tax=Streptomyces sp. NPDC047079 TaxID=3154607 RepID=UPI0033C9CE80